MTNQNSKRISFGKAIIPIIYLIIALFFTLKYFDGDPHIPILSATVVAAAIAVSSGQKWTDLEEAMFDTIKMSLQAIVILAIVGMIIGTWILSGTVPTMIYYGLKMISPNIFLVATCLICCIVSLATGSSWTTAGTIGIALMGVGQGLGIPLPMVAGAIISGSYFGDKMSPLSDTTNLAPAMAGSNLFEHIKHMLYTTVPSLAIALILYGVLGIKYAGKNLDTSNIDVILDAMSNNFNISPLLLIPPVLVILMVVMKIPAIPGLIGGTILGGLFAYLFQGSGMSAIIEAAHYGFVSETGVDYVDELLTRGGLDSMMWTISLILIAMCFGGVMEKSGMLNAITEKILSLAKNTGSLVTATVFTCIFTNAVAGDQYLSIVIPGRMYKSIYEEKGLQPKNLSRVLEDSGTLTSPFIPWNTCGAFMNTTLGVHPFEYGIYAFLNLLNPIISIIYGFTGYSMERINEEGNSK